VCVKVVAGFNLSGDGPNYQDNVPATEAIVTHPKDVSVDDAGNIYIAGRSMHNIAAIQQISSLIQCAHWIVCATVASCRCIEADAALQAAGLVHQRHPDEIMHT
jgi:hypothetical protein